MTDIKDESHLFDGGDASTQCPNCVRLREDLNFMTKKVIELLTGMKKGTEDLDNLRKDTAKAMGFQID